MIHNSNDNKEQLRFQYNDEKNKISGSNLRKKLRDLWLSSYSQDESFLSREYCVLARSQDYTNL